MMKSINLNNNRRLSSHINIFLLLINILLISGIIFFFSCHAPPFSTDLSLSLTTITKLNLEAKHGPLYIDNYEEYENDVVHFVPDKTNSSTGFCVLEHKGDIIINYVDQGGNLYGYYYKDKGYSGPQDKNEPNYIVEALQDNPGYGIFIRLGDWDQHYALFKYESEEIHEITAENFNNRLYDDFNSGVGGFTSWISLDHYPELCGAYINPVDSRLYIIAVRRDSDLDPFYYYECNYQITTSDLTDPLQTYGDTYFEPADPTLDVFYFHDTINAKSFMSFMKDSAFINFIWDNNMSLEKLPFQTAIHKLLSDSTLYTLEDQIATIYNQDGKKLFRFPMGKLELRHESKISGTYQMGFTLCTDIARPWEGDYDDYWYDREFFFYSYSYPTANIESLAY